MERTDHSKQQKLQSVRQTAYDHAIIEMVRLRRELQLANEREEKRELLLKTINDKLQESAIRCENLKAGRESQRLEIERLTARIESLVPLESHLLTVKRQLEEVNKELHKVKEQNEKLQKLNSAQNRTVNALESKCSYADTEIVKCYRKIQSLMAEHETLLKENHRLKSELDDFRQGGPPLDKSIPSNDQNVLLELLSKEKNELLCRMQELTGELERTQLALQRQGDAIQQKHSEQIDTLHQKLQDRDRHYASELDALRCETCQVQQEVEEKKRHIKKLEVDLESMRHSFMDSEQRRQKLEARLDAYKTKYMNTIKELMQMSERCTAAEKVHASLNQMEEELRLEKSAKLELEKKLVMYEERDKEKQVLAEYKHAEDRQAEVKARLNALQQKYESLKTKYEAVQEECKFRRKQNRDMLQSRVAHLEKVCEKLQADNQEFRQRSCVSHAPMECDEAPERQRHETVPSSPVPEVPPASNVGCDDDADLVYSIDDSWCDMFDSVHYTTKKNNSSGRHHS